MKVMWLVSSLVAVAGLTGCQSAPMSMSLSGLTVQRVVDGDTFVTSAGEKVRVLGIDSCEMGTEGGAAAKKYAEDMILGHSIELKSQPGVDKDRYGRSLRYVLFDDGRDYGKLSVIFPHTGVYAGHNDASSDYVNTLRALDDGRNCGGAVVAADNSVPPVIVVSNDDENHKSRFCRRHWYC